jgi:hypothetical protein
MAPGETLWTNTRRSTAGPAYCRTTRRTRRTSSARVERTATSAHRVVMSWRSGIAGPRVGEGRPLLDGAHATVTNVPSGRVRGSPTSRDMPQGALRSVPPRQRGSRSQRLRRGGARADHGWPRAAGWDAHSRRSHARRDGLPHDAGFRGIFDRGVAPPPTVDLPSAAERSDLFG